MDRTKEFHSIQSAHDINPNHTKTPFFEDAFNLDNNIRGILSEVESLTAYESFKAMGLLSRASALLKQYRAIKIEDAYSRDHQSVIDGLRAIIKRNILRHTLRMNSLSRKHRSAEQPQQREAAMKPVKPQMDSALLEEQQNSIREDFMHERRRIVKSISEIGQIVEDISIHVSLQEEQLKRIDDVVMKTETYSKRALSELKEAWGTISQDRRTIIKFFVFWVLLTLLLFFLKRSSR